MARRGRGFLFGLVAACLVAAVPAAHAEKRVALVVGIDQYPNLKADQQLRKAVNDARSVVETLRALNYDVTAGENVTGLEFDRLWQGFLNRLEPGDVAAFFFSGHGIQLRDGVNYLLPRDVPAVAPSEEMVLRRQSISFAELLQELRTRGPRVSLMILDACRDDPFAETGKKSVVGTRGLTRVEPPRGTFVMFSAGAGESALDRLSEQDRDPNSVYTRRLLPHLRTPGLALSEVAERVREEVYALARTSPAHPNHEQLPAYYNQMIGKFCLAGCDKEDGTKASLAPAPDPVESDYERVERIGTVPAWDAFLAVHGGNVDNLYVKLARAAREKRAKEQDIAIGIFPPPEPKLHRAPSPACDGVRAKAAGAEWCLKPKDAFRDCPDCPEMVVIPAGRFTMGSPPSEQERSNDEGPQHEVTIPRAFAVGKFEVTFAEWEACVSAGGCGDHRPSDQGWGKGSHPVINVSWDDAKAYVAWLSRKVGGSYRLLSEAEWEYAARAGATTPFSTGERITTEEANFDGNHIYNGSRKGVYRLKTVPAGSFAASAFGLHDMHGNVWEWAEDCYQDNYDGAPTDASAKTTGTCIARVLRGGSWFGSPRYLRAAVRSWGRPDFRYVSTGFRVARKL